MKKIYSSHDFKRFSDNKIFILLSFIFLIVFLSCRKQIDFEDKDKDSILVVNSIMNSDSNYITINVSKSMSILDNNDEVIFLGNASVNLAHDDQFIGTATYEGNGNFAIQHIPVANNSYLLTVKHQGFQDVWAEIIFPEKTDFSIKNTQIREESEVVKCVLEFQDDAKIKNCYILAVYITIETIYEETEWQDADTLINSYFLDLESYDASIDDYSYLNYNTGLLFDDGKFNGDIKNFEFNVNFNFSPNYYSSSATTIKDMQVRMFTINEAYYKYLRSRMIQEWIGDDPFAENVIVFSNINNGAGIFTGVNINSKKLDVEIPKEWYTYEE